MTANIVIPIVPPNARHDANNVPAVPLDICSALASNGIGYKLSFEMVGSYSRYDGTAYDMTTTGMTVVTPTPRPINPVNTSIMAPRLGVTNAKRPQNREMRNTELASSVRYRRVRPRRKDEAETPIKARMLSGK